MTDKPKKLTYNMVVQMSPVGRYENPDGDPLATMTLDEYTKMMLQYFVDNLRRYADPRGADLFVTLIVTDGTSAIGHEFRSGHYVKE